MRFALDDVDRGRASRRARWRCAGSTTAGRSGPARVWMRLRHPLLPDEPAVLARPPRGHGRLRQRRQRRAAVRATSCSSTPISRSTCTAEPRGEWIGLDARTLLHGAAAALAESVLHDLDGPSAAPSRRSSCSPAEAGYPRRLDECRPHEDSCVCKQCSLRVDTITILSPLRTKGDSDVQQPITQPRRRSPLPTGTWNVDPVHSSVEFQVKHLGIATVKGQFKEFEGTLEVTPDGVTPSAAQRSRASTRASPSATRTCARPTSSTPRPSPRSRSPRLRSTRSTRTASRSRATSRSTA